MCGRGIAKGFSTGSVGLELAVDLFLDRTTHSLALYRRLARSPSSSSSPPPPNTKHQTPNTKHHQHHYQHHLKKARGPPNPKRTLPHRDLLLRRPRPVGPSLPRGRSPRYRGSVCRGRRGGGKWEGGRGGRVGGVEWWWDSVGAVRLARCGCACACGCV